MFEFACTEASLTTRRIGEAGAEWSEKARVESLIPAPPPGEGWSLISVQLVAAQARILYFWQGEGQRQKCMQEQLRMCQGDLELRTKERDQGWRSIDELKEEIRKLRLESADGQTEIIRVLNECATPPWREPTQTIPERIRKIANERNEAQQECIRLRAEIADFHAGLAQIESTLSKAYPPGHNR